MLAFHYDNCALIHVALLVDNGTRIHVALHALFFNSCLHCITSACTAFAGRQGWVVARDDTHSTLPLPLDCSFLFLPPFGRGNVVSPMWSLPLFPLRWGPKGVLPGS